jgi:hypothetical protein
VTTRDPARDRASISSVGLIIVDAGQSAKRSDRFRVYPVRAAGERMEKNGNSEVKRIEAADIVIGDLDFSTTSSLRLLGLPQRT